MTARETFLTACFVGIIGLSAYRWMQRKKIGAVNDKIHQLADNAYSGGPINTTDTATSPSPVVPVLSGNEFNPIRQSPVMIPKDYVMPASPDWLNF